MEQHALNGPLNAISVNELVVELGIVALQHLWILCKANC